MAAVRHTASLGTMAGRALHRRCLHCGIGRVFRGFWKMNASCPNCGHKFERESGYWVGAVIFNMTVAIGAFLLTFGGILIVTWPDVPWDWVAPVTVAVSVVVPVLLYPWAQCLWMAYDLYVHPLEPDEIMKASARLEEEHPRS